MLLYHAELCNLLADLFSAMIHLCYVPSSLSNSFIIPIPKGKELDLTDPRNYRGISVSSVLSKVFEAVLLTFISDPLESCLHGLQGGFRKSHSTSHTSYILQEARLSNQESRAI